MASNDSTAPFGLPGTLTMRRPTADADDPARQVGQWRARPADGAHRLGETGDLVVDDGLGGLWGHVAWRQSGATGRDDEGVAAGGLDEGGLDRPLLVGDHEPLDGEAQVRQALLETRAGSVLADAGRDPIADRDDERRSERRLAHRRLTRCPCASTRPDRRLARRGAAWAPARPVAAPGGSTSRSCRRSWTRGARRGSRHRARRP